MAAPTREIDFEKHSGSAVNEEHVKQPEQHKTNGKGILLVPQSSDDPKDPLNWSMTKKIFTLCLVSLAALASTLSCLANSSGFEAQAKAYNKSLTEISYTLCSSVSGLAIGPFIWNPISKLSRVSRGACIVWSLVLTILFNIWSALMTGPNDYIPFVVSRLFAAMASCGAFLVGGDIIMDIFFLHERGRAFGVFTTALLFGTVSSGTFSGFITEDVNWTVQFWYNIAFEGLVVILCLVGFQETGWTRPNGEIHPPIPEGEIRRRLVTFFFAGPVMPRKTSREILYAAIVPILLAISPVSLLAGSYLLISFGFAVAKQTMLAVYLQTPVEFGGYGFSQRGTALFTFSNWLGVIVAQFYTLLLNDRLPLWICKRYGDGIWKPEYRLHTALWIPSVITLPVGFGLFGACLQYHLHYMVLAFASFLIIFSSLVTAPVIITYVADCFTHLPNEAIAVVNVYRVVLGIAVPFFIAPWFAATGPGWAFGMMAFFTLLADCFVVCLIMYGHAIREYSLVRRHDSDEGVHIIEEIINQGEA